MEDIAFDDIARLKAKISDTFGGWSDPIEVTQDMINRFAELTGDHQWIHVDVERAKRESPFKAHDRARLPDAEPAPRHAQQGGVEDRRATATPPTTAPTSCASCRRCPRARRSTRTGG